MPSWLLQTLLAGFGSLAMVAVGAVIDLRARMAVIENNEALLMEWGRDTDKILSERQRYMAQIERMQRDIDWLLDDKRRQLEDYRRQAQQPVSPASPHTVLQGP